MKEVAPRTKDPTPSEIRAACLKIQSEWTATQRYNREQGKRFFTSPENERVRLELPRTELTALGVIEVDDEGWD